MNTSGKSLISRMLRRISPVLLAVLVLAPGVIFSEGDMPDITVDPKSVEITGINGKRIKLKMFAEIAYPQSAVVVKPLFLASIKSKIYVNDTYVMKVNTEKNLEFKESITSDFEVSVRYEDLLKAAPALADKEQICKVEATFFFIVDKDLGFNTRKITFEKKLPSYKKAVKEALKDAF